MHESCLKVFMASVGGHQEESENFPNFRLVKIQAMTAMPSQVYTDSVFSILGVILVCCCLVST